MGPSRLAAWTAFGLVVTAAVFVGSGAQGQVSGPRSQAPTIKSEVQIVLVDVVVTIGDGRPVAGLRKEDFQVTEDGRPQTISFFEEHNGAAPTTISLPPMPANVFTNYPKVKSTDSVNVLLLDSLNTQAPDQTFMRAQMTKYLQAAASAPAGVRLAVFTLGSRLRMVRGFTANPSDLLTVLSDPRSGTDPKVMKELATPFQKATDALMIGSQMSPVGIAEIKEFLEEESASQGADRAWMTLQAFQQLARFLSSIRGRKNVLWLSGSFPISFFPTSDARGNTAGQYQSDIRQTADLLVADQVAVYPILATGLTTNTVYNPDNFGRPIEADDDGRAFNQIAMETIARDTGGRAFYNSNALNDAMAQAVDEGSNYYTLTYAPTNTKMDGKYRHIELKTTNGVSKLAYRRGYYAENAKFAPVNADERKNEKKKSDALMPLMAFGMPDFEQILYKVQLVKTKPGSDANRAGSNTELKGPLVRCGLDFAISAQDLTLEKSADGVRRGNMEVMLVAYDRDGALLNSFRKKSEIVLDPKAYLEVMRVGLQMHREIDLPDGEVLLRMGVYDLNSGKVGTLGTWLAGEK